MALRWHGIGEFLGVNLDVNTNAILPVRYNSIHFCLVAKFFFSLCLCS